MQILDKRSRRLAALCIPTAIALAACGGSDDPPTAVVAPSAALTLSGTAATGAAIAGGTVDAKCATGDGSATTAADGSYSVALSAGALPCVLRVTSADGATVLHSVASGTGNSATANITPVSELVIARLAGGDPASYFGGFGSGAAAGLGTAQVDAAVAAVVDTLKSAGVDFSAIGNVLTVPLVAASGATAGNGFDQALEALKTQLASAGVSLTELRDTVAQNSPAAPVTALSATPSLPAELLLRPAAANCKALRSGTYRLVFFAPGEGGAVATDTLVIDATTLKGTNSDGSVDFLVAAGDCQYTVPSIGEFVVSASGVAVFRSGERPGFVAAMAFPEQQHPVSVTAGTWNFLGRDAEAQLYGGEITVDGAGKVTADVVCEDLHSCVAQAPGARMVFSANAAGGFDFDFGRAFAYRAGGGELMIVVVHADGEFALATRKVARTLPAVGTVNRNWDFTITPQYTAPAPADSENVAVALAPDGSSYSRNAVINFATGATRPETLQINQPRDGFLHRVPETVTTSTGGSSVVGEWVGLTLRGIGITPVAIVNNNNMILSVRKP